MPPLWSSSGTAPNRCDSLDLKIPPWLRTSPYHYHPVSGKDGDNFEPQNFLSEAEQSGKPCACPAAGPLSPGCAVSIRHVLSPLGHTGYSRLEPRFHHWPAASLERKSVGGVSSKVLTALALAAVVLLWPALSRSPWPVIQKGKPRLVGGI